MPEDIASLEKAMIEARLAGDSAKALELLDKVIALKASGQGGDSGPPSVPTVDPLAAAPPMGDKPVDPNATPAAKPLEEQGYAKAIEVLIAARPDLTKEQRAYAKACKSLDTAATYLITIPFAKTQQEPKAAPAKPLDDKAPRPGANDGQMRLGKTDKDSVLAVAKAMGQATEPVRGPTILTGPDGSKKFTLGNLTPTQYRAKRATGWDPRKSFPLGSEVVQ